jgi:tetratricopeptide (TPR) repeat protein
MKSLLLLLFLSVGLPASQGGQTIDPFYAVRFEAGLSLMEAGRYEEAFKEFEVAGFGLSARKDLWARIHVLKGLCQSKLGNKSKAFESLAAAAELVGWDALPLVSVPEPVKPDLPKLIAEARKNPPPKAEEKAAPLIVSVEKPAPDRPVPSDVPSKAAPAEKPVGKPNPDPVEGFRRLILADPRYPSPYYSLAEHFAQRGDFGAARKTLRDLLRNIPTEVRGHLELGRLAYEARDLKEAGKSLERFLALAEKSADERSKDEARALLILVSYLRGDDKKARAVLAASAGLFTPARLAALTLAPREVDRVLVIRAELGKK